MDAILSIVLLASVYCSGKLILRFVSHRSTVLPQLLFLEAEVERISGQIDDEQISSSVFRSTCLGCERILNGFKRTWRDSAIVFGTKKCGPISY